MMLVNARSWLMAARWLRVAKVCWLPMLHLLLPALHMTSSARLCAASTAYKPVKHFSAGGPSTYPTDRKCVVLRKSDDVDDAEGHPANDQFQWQAPTRTMS